MDIRIVSDPSAAEIDAVVAILGEASEQARPGANLRSLGFLIEDPETGAVAGGLIARAIYDWMFVQLLSVSPKLRGQGYGKALMARAEDWARAEGLVGIWLDTFAFQAPKFYAGLGFTPFGTIADHPTGSRRIFFEKRLAPLGA